ncbi:MAG: M48 family metalloprotease [Desulfovibrio sp.]|jgi:predicted Zn-dependent protease|nr:M48 family metalloprotease [Desulfovibrio sp.]
MSLPAARRLLFYAHCALAWLLIVFLAVQTFPLQAHAFFGGVTIKDEKEMGRKFDAMIRSNLSFVEDPEVKQYVAYITDRLVRAMPKQVYAFNSSVILNNALNAFAVPGGYIYVFSGLIMHFNSEDELAGVMAHELAHVTQRHVASRLERAQFVTLASLLLAVAGVAAGGAGGAVAVGAMSAGQAAMLNYSRLDETDADQIGLQYLAAAGYPPNGMTGGFKVLRQKSMLNGTSVPAYLSTHPAIGERINTLQSRIAAMPAQVRGRKQDNTRFKRVNTLLWARYGDEQAALQRFAKNDALSAMGRGIVLNRLNRIPQAAAAFDKALAADPDDSLVLREAGIFHFRRGEMGQAETLLTKALRLDPRDYMAVFFYARMLDESGRGAESARHYEDVLRYVPEDAEVHEAYARSLGKAGKQFEAYVHLTYSTLYANRRKLAERYFAKAKSLAGNASDKRPFQRLETAYNERREIWEKQ